MKFRIFPLLAAFVPMFALAGGKLKVAKRNTISSVRLLPFRPNQAKW